MVTYNRFRVMIALSVATSFSWITMRNSALADEPRDSTVPPAATSTPTERYLLLTNAHVIKGIISERATDYQVVQRVGAMSFPKSTLRARSTRSLMPINTESDSFPSATPKSA